jgi:hypothetical protein
MAVLAGGFLVIVVLEAYKDYINIDYKAPHYNLN